MAKRTFGGLAALTLVLASCGINSNPAQTGATTAPVSSELSSQAVSGTNIDTWRRQII